MSVFGHPFRLLVDTGDARELWRASSPGGRTRRQLSSGRERSLLITTTDRFAKNLTRQRLAAPLTQGELAALASLHRSEISLLERAGREPRLATIAKLAGALSIESGALFEGIAWLPSPATAGRFALSED